MEFKSTETTIAVIVNNILAALAIQDTPTCQTSLLEALEPLQAIHEEVGYTIQMASLLRFAKTMGYAPKDENELYRGFCSPCGNQLSFMGMQYLHNNGFVYDIRRGISSYSNYLPQGRFLLDIASFLAAKQVRIVHNTYFQVSRKSPNKLKLQKAQFCLTSTEIEE